MTWMRFNRQNAPKRVDCELPLIQTGFVLNVGTVFFLEHYKKVQTCRDTTANALPVTAHHTAALKMQVRWTVCRTLSE